MTAFHMWVRVPPMHISDDALLECLKLAWQSSIAKLQSNWQVPQVLYYRSLGLCLQMAMEMW